MQLQVATLSSPCSFLLRFKRATTLISDPSKLSGSEMLSESHFSVKNRWEIDAVVIIFINS